jgi:hypothetical protein
MMKKLLLLLVLLANLCLVNSQDYDLIVRSNGDSIACHIDSITDTHIYFEMKSNKYWKHTYINKADVIEFQRNAINKRAVVFKPGTSIIEKIIEPVPPISEFNAVKTDAFSWMAGVWVLKYERVFNENISAQLGFLFSSDWPTFRSECSAKGFAITPEFRYYLSKKPAPRGVYLAPNFRYMKIEEENHEEDGEATVKVFSPAINLGIQFVLKDVLLIDAWVGPTFNIRSLEETIPDMSASVFGNNAGLRGRIGASIGFVF